MKSAILVLAASILVPSILAAVTNSTHDTNEEQCEHLDSSQQVSEGESRTVPPLSILCLKYFVEDLCYERHFASEQARDDALSKIIALDYNEIVRQAKGAEACGEIEPSDFSKCVLNSLSRSDIVKALPKLPSSDPKARLLNMFGGVGGFLDLPLVVRQFIAANYIWPAWSRAEPTICTLSHFLSSFHDKFDSFKDSLASMESVTVMAYVKIVLGIDCVVLSVQNRANLLISIRSLFPESELFGMVGSLHGRLSADSSISDIYNVVKSECPDLLNTVALVLRPSPEHKLADWCMTLLARPTFSWFGHEFDYCLLFSAAFLKKHGISEDDRNALLKRCRVRDLLDSLPADLTGLDIPKLIQWVKGNANPNTLSLSNLITIYSLDDSPDEPDEYLQSPRHMNVLTFAEIALGFDYARHLSCEKRILLLKRLDSARLSKWDFSSDGFRKALIVEIVSLYDDNVMKRFVSGLSDSDFSLFAEACLEYPEKCQLPHWLNYLQRDRAAQALISYIAKDISKAANLHNLPEEYQVRMFILAGCDAVAENLTWSFTKEALVRYFRIYLDTLAVGLSQEKVSRIARKVHEYHQP